MIVQTIVDKLSASKSFHGLIPVSVDRIDSVEKQLNLNFADEYRAYVQAYGAASMYGHELTGICDIPRLDVAAITIEERKDNPLIPNEWYVIEQANIDGIVIWQSPTGEIYQSQPGKKPVLIARSLSEYLNL